MTSLRASDLDPTLSADYFRPTIRAILPRLVISMLFMIALAGVASAAVPDLSGVWSANDGGTYYVRQSQNVVWWLGWAPAGSNDFHKGIGFSNVFRGTISGSTIMGEWADVPRGQTLGSGSLTLTIVSPSQLSLATATGGFGGSIWQKVPSVPNQPVLDINGVFGLVQKNQNGIEDRSLLDNLKPAKRSATFFGSVVLDPERNVHLGYPPNASRAYSDFICLNNNDSPPDGDLNLSVSIDVGQLNSQGDFFEVGWEDWGNENPLESSNVLRAKIARFNEIHGESIMYGRTVACNGGNYEIPPLLPGWQEFDSNSILVNGIPLNGRIGTTPQDSNSMNVSSLLMEPIGPNTHLRLAGTLVLDCGHRGDLGQLLCDEDDDPTAEHGFQNQEVHPIYSIDLIQDFTGPRPGVNLTGVWAADDMGTYYVRQIRDAVWWLGLSQDQGRRFVNIFKGTVDGSSVRGQWMDLPIFPNGTTNQGTLTLTSNGPGSIQLNRSDQRGGFGAQSWSKLYDLKYRSTTLTVVTATTSAVSLIGGEFSAAGFPGQFEFTLNGIRKLATPMNARVVPLGFGARGSRADLGVAVTFQGRTSIPFLFTAICAGWRLVLSSLDHPEDFAPGDHTVRLTPPSNTPRPAPPPPGPQRGPVMKPPHDLDPGSAPLPTISVTYHVDVLDASDLASLPPNN